MNRVPRTVVRGRRILLLLVALFALPFATAVGLHLAGWRPAASAPHGRFAASTAALPWQGLRPLPGTPAPDVLAGHWTLVLASAGPCDAVCAAQLAALRRVQVATNKQMTRIKRLWLTPDPAGDPARQALTADYPDLLVAAPGDSAWRALLPTSGQRLALLDPGGHPVLHYPDPFDPRGVLRDLERLLKYSWTG